MRPNRSRFAKVQISALFLTSLLLITCGSAFAAPAAATPSTSAYVYVGAGTSNGGMVYGFAVASNGSAQPVSGSPYAGASGSVVGANSYLFATDGRNIVTYTLQSGGALDQTSSVNGVAYDQDPQSASVVSLSIPPDGRNVYSDNWYFDGANNDYETWMVGGAGQLSYQHRPGGPLYSTAVGWPLSFTANGTFAYTWGICKWNGDVWGAARAANGLLTEINPQAKDLPGSQPWNGSACSQGVATSSLGFVAVAWNGGYCCGGPTGIATYALQSNGTLTQVPMSQVDAPENAMAFDPSGQYLAVAVNGAVQTYQLQSNGRLTPIASLQVPGTLFSNLLWDNANHLYAIDGQSSQQGLYVFNSNAGALSMAPGSPVVISQPSSLAVLPAP